MKLIGKNRTSPYHEIVMIGYDVDTLEQYFLVASNAGGRLRHDSTWLGSLFDSFDDVLDALNLWGPTHNGGRLVNIPNLYDQDSYRDVSLVWSNAI